MTSDERSAAAGEARAGTPVKTCAQCGAQVARFEAFKLCHQCYRLQPRQVAYSRWRNMVARCTKPDHPEWKNYGGRGITIDPHWMDFDCYYADTGDRPAPGMSIDRVNNDGPYSPDNWRWATQSEQNRNSRRLKPECRHGHAYTEENTSRDKDGYRICRACRRVIKARFWAKQAAA